MKISGRNKREDIWLDHIVDLIYEDKLVKHNEYLYPFHNENERRFKVCV